MLKRPASGDFRVQAELGGTVALRVPTAAERAVADAVLAAAPGVATHARIDLVTTPDGPLLMEAELIDPELFLPDDPDAAGRFAGVLGEQLDATRERPRARRVGAGPLNPGRPRCL